jgi:hypothetical protein
MKLAELQDVCDEAELMIDICSRQVRGSSCETNQDEEKLYWIIGYCTVLRDELHEHIRTLERILRVCEAVKQGRYLEDWQRCNRVSMTFQCTHACMSTEQCNGFDARDPYTVIAKDLAELEAFSEPLRRWIVYQQDMQRSRRKLIFGPDGLFGRAKLVRYEHDGSGVLKPVHEEDAGPMWATEDAKEDAKNESMGLRLDQYELNIQRIAQIFAVNGHVGEIAIIIETGVPPQVRTAIVAS